jgi:hypothetical protein
MQVRQQESRRNQDDTKRYGDRFADCGFHICLAIKGFTPVTN